MRLDQKAIDEWVALIRKEGERPCTYTKEYIDPFSIPMYIFQSIEADYFLRIESEGYDPFYCYFQPCFRKQAPLIVHTPRLWWRDEHASRTGSIFQCTAY